MLKLKKVQLLGFKSFCDKTEIALPGSGIAIVVGPNGCGKSNILDGVTWVLGEQSAKTLRGGKMEDVIFAGTRERRALGMSEVSITLIDPEAYEGGPLLPEPEIIISDPNDTDWDETKLRAERAEEVEQIIAESQPGQIIEGQEQSEAPTATESANSDVVLKIRRRKFQKTPQRGEIVVSRRLFRTGESEYLLNGKLCRLRDIQDIFMGTGLGPESYAIIGQERIGQLLSSKPHDRRAIIEEAAGITRFKTKKRLAELRLEQAKQNLARIDDIFDEVVRQMTSLKRQAAKAERYGLLRDELRARLRVVLRSKLLEMAASEESLRNEMEALSAQVEEQAAGIETRAAELAEGQARGYELDATGKEAASRASASAVELERARTRQAANSERIAELHKRSETGASELETAKTQREALAQEGEGHRTFLATASGEAEGFRAQAAQRQNDARSAAGAVSNAEARVEQARRDGTQILQRIAQARREHAQAEESLASTLRDADRLGGEMEAAKRDLESLGVERGQVSLRFESATDGLKRLEGELAAMRSEIATKRNEEATARRNGDTLRSERARLSGRRDSLEGLLRDHSYSTDTVKKLLRANSLQGDLKPIGTLADFLEVGQQHEQAVDEFLREELNYIVVKNWSAADEGVRLLRTGGVDGRATFLVHPEGAEAKFSTNGATPRVEGVAGEGVVSLRECLRVLDGFQGSLETLLPRLRNGFITNDADQARSLALQHPHAFFLAPTGEQFHNLTVTGGKPRTGGPLALKRELRDIQETLSSVETQLAQAETEVATLVRSIAELSKRTEGQQEERRRLERESAQESAALRQMDGEKQRLERRLQESTLQNERNRSQRDEKTALIARKSDEASQLEAEHASLEGQQGEFQAVLAEARAAQQTSQAAAAQMSAELAGLEERRRAAEANVSRTERLFREAESRVMQLEQQLAAAAQEQTQREQENESLAASEAEQRGIREAAEAEMKATAEEARALRARLAELEGELKRMRAESDRVREGKTQKATAHARLSADLTHLGETCLQDLGVEAQVLRDDAEVATIAGEELGVEEEACRELKRKLEAMGPVNMMALEEFKETEQRHAFLETQRKDLLDSIENTRSTIKELDSISRTKFDDAFVKINENFNTIFMRLFGGGGASMRLTDEENSADSGVDIVAQPPGKKLQNVFLLSGGEKALTALSLLMGIFLFQPAPFCILDEVDAPLDETNVGRLSELLRSMAADTQFLMVTHSKRMMSAADLIYGVTMQEPGVSKVVSVRMHSGETPAPQRRLPVEQRALVSA